MQAQRLVLQEIRTSEGTSMKWMKPLGNMLIPTVLFYAAYRVTGIIPAVILSLAYSLISAIYAKIKNSTVKNSQVIGILGLAASIMAMCFTGEEKLYYIPALIENILFLGCITVLSFRRKSVLHYLAKDFEIESLRQIHEESMFSVNAIWIIYFALKIISKLVGILYLDFNELYWLVFLLGDPMTVLVIIISVILIRMHYSKGR